MDKKLERRLYWDAFWTSLFSPFRRVKNAVRRSVQRLRYGCDETCAWSIDYALARWMSKTLGYLSDKPAGFPANPEFWMDENLYESVYKRQVERDKLLENKQLSDMLYREWVNTLKGVKHKFDVFLDEDYRQEELKSLPYHELNWNDKNGGPLEIKDSTPEKETDNKRYYAKMDEIKADQYKQLKDGLQWVVDHLEVLWD